MADVSLDDLIKQDHTKAKAKKTFVKVMFFPIKKPFINKFGKGKFNDRDNKFKGDSNPHRENNEQFKNKFIKKRDGNNQPFHKKEQREQVQSPKFKPQQKAEKT
jgi:hypothetical protein